MSAAHTCDWGTENRVWDNDCHDILGRHGDAGLSVWKHTRYRTHLLIVETGRPAFSSLSLSLYSSVRPFPISLWKPFTKMFGREEKYFDESNTIVQGPDVERQFRSKKQTKQQPNQTKPNNIHLVVYVHYSNMILSVLWLSSSDQVERICNFWREVSHIIPW